MHDIDYIKRWKLLGVHSNKYDLNSLIKNHEDGNIIQTLCDIGVTDTDIIIETFRNEIRRSRPYSKFYKTLYKYIGSERVVAMLSHEYNDIILNVGDKMKVGKNGYIWFNDKKYDDKHYIGYTYTYSDRLGTQEIPILNGIEIFDNRLYLRKNRMVTGDSRYIELLMDRNGNCSNMILEYSAVQMRKQVVDTEVVYMERE